MFKNLFSFDGRIRRTEFALSLIVIYPIIAFVVYICSRIDPEEPLSLGISLLSYIVLLWFRWSQGAKRCHDRGNSGWWQIIPFYVLWLLFAEGDAGPNEYGEDPKGRLNEYQNFTSPSGNQETV